MFLAGVRNGVSAIPDIFAMGVTNVFEVNNVQVTTRYYSNVI